MPDPIITPAEGDVLNVAEQNEKVKRELENQGRPALPGSDIGDSGSALDKLAEEKTKEKEAAADKPPEVVVPPPDDEAAKKAAAEAEKVAAEKKVAEEKANEYFKDAPTLPPNASPKSSEAFQSIKVKAAQEISAREQKIEELNKKVKEFEEKLKNPIPPELEKEIKDLREWRAKLDVDADPQFKSFNQSIAAAQEFIYAQLQENPKVSAEVLAEIKKYGGPEKCDLSKLFELTADPTLQRLVESKIADIKMMEFNRAQAIKSAKQNIAQYVEGRQKAFEQAETAHFTETKQALSELTANLDWWKPMQEDPKNPEIAKAHNAFLSDTQAQLEAALQDPSPQMRAIMLVGMANLFRLQNLYPVVKDRAEKAEKALAEATEKLDKIKKAGVSRLRESSAPPSSQLPAKKESDLFTKTAGESLDDLAKDMMAKRATANV